MRLRPAILGLGLAVLSGGAAAALDPSADQLKDAGACATAADPPICLLGVVAAADSEQLRQDLDLRAHPELLVAAGVDPYKPYPNNPDNPDRPRDEAVEAVLAKLRTGASVDAALQVIAALPDRDETQFASPRLRAYQRLWTLHQAGAPAAASRELARSVLARWEAELARNALSDAATDPLALADAYIAFGDQAAADRVIEFGAPLTDSERIDRLRTAGRLKEAAALAINADVALDEARRRETFERYNAPGLAKQDAFNTQLQARIRQALAQMRADGKTQQAVKLEAELGPLLGASPGKLEAGRAEIPLSAWADLNQSRGWLLEALAKAREPLLARDVADAILKAPLGSFQPWDFPMVLKSASPAAAQSWLARMEAAIAAGELPDEDNQNRLADRTTMVLLGWPAVGQPDRADAAYRRWLPAARVEVARRKAGGYEATPYTDAITAYLVDQDRTGDAPDLFYDHRGAARRLANDIVRGRGIANLDAYLSGPDDLGYVLKECAQAAGRQLRFDVGEACLARGAELKSPSDRQILVNAALGLAYDAAHADRLADARRFYAEALELHARAGEPGRAADWDVMRTLHELAKAELRAGGRLPVQKAAP